MRGLRQGFLEQIAADLPQAVPRKGKTQFWGYGHN